MNCVAAATGILVLFGAHSARIEPFPGSHLLGYVSGLRMPHRSMERRHGDDLFVLLNAAKSGCTEAIGRLLAQHRDYLHTIASEELTRTGLQTHSPSDVVQTAQLEVCRDLPSFQGETVAEFRGWLRRILLNNIADNRRRKKPAAVPLAIDPPADDRSPSSQVAADEANLNLYALIKSLPEDEQKVIQLRYFEGMTYSEIAAVIGRTPDATRKLWVRTLARLQLHMRRQA